MNMDYINAGIALVAAIGSVTAAYVGWQIKRLQVTAIKRKSPIVERRRVAANGLPLGWSRYELTVRNVEAVSVDAIRLEATPTAGKILEIRDAYEPDPPHVLLPQFKKKLLGTQAILLSKRISPKGTPTRTGKPQDIATFHVVGSGLKGPEEIKVIWSWADSQNSQP